MQLLKIRHTGYSLCAHISARRNILADHAVQLVIIGRNPAQLNRKHATSNIDAHDIGNHLVAQIGRESDYAASARMDTLMPQLMQTAGVTEELKAADPLRWVGLMNTLKAQAEEVILSELIYAEEQEVNP